eukprot:1159180-Pelagomonas_calceolata.AAC.4
MHRPAAVARAAASFLARLVMVQHTNRPTSNSSRGDYKGSVPPCAHLLHDPSQDRVRLALSCASPSHPHFGQGPGECGTLMGLEHGKCSPGLERHWHD